MSGCDVLAERADGAKGEDGAYAEVFESGDVGAGGDGGRRDVVVFPVARDEGDVCPGGECADGDGRGGVSPGLDG